GCVAKEIFGGRPAGRNSKGRSVIVCFSASTLVDSSHNFHFGVCSTNPSKTVPEEFQSLYPNEQSNFDKDQLAKSSDVEKELMRASSDAERNSRPSAASSAQSAAAFFENISLRNDSSILQACESIDRLNQYLKARKADVKAGVPGQFLHAVIGQAVAGMHT
ncbi:hypothetical protein GW17_00006048, partial [Ensete ventricosum]